MQDFIYFLGRFHVLALHLPIALVLVAVLLDWLARSARYQQLAAALPFLWGLAAISAVLTAALGYMHLAEGTFTGPSASAHRFFGTSVGVLAVVLWWLCSRHADLYKKINITTGVVALALVTITGHYGGNLTHGETFLLQFAPGASRSRQPAEGTTAFLGAGAADPELVGLLYTNGFLVRQVSPTDPHIVVSIYSPGAHVVAQHMAILESAANEIAELNLQDAGVDDSLLANIGKFNELTRLRLSRNEVTDRTVVAIAASMPKLERLNLYANRGVTDASIEVFAGMQSLRRLDIWRTSISEEGMARLRDLRPDIELQGETTEVIRAVDPLPPVPSGAR
jgi:uncharacterized membrane protein